MGLFSFSLNDDKMKLAPGLVNTSTLVLSLVSLLLVSLDRVAATFYPFAHRAAGSALYIKVFALTWCIALVIAFLPVFITEWKIYGHDVWFRTLDFLCILCLIVIMLSYTAIFIKIRLKNKKHRQHEQELSTRRRQKREKHLAMTLFIVTVLSLMTWLPFIINHEIELVASLPPGPAQHNIELLTEIVQLTNSLINPIVYVFRMKEFREALFHAHVVQVLAGSATSYLSFSG
ncbi:adenosine receptor A2a-like [Exaiptasia diaphana]|uniref:G-protein coupled receptors family 1 profile domain-containing protein n=1 Tax=Exaiptasia diaphana TaxID=2652724 RepID=A0A913XWN9_EXADI|nr:adenosine receptor A2a-like [Exaiptasia diaphana]